MLIRSKIAIFAPLKSVVNKTKEIMKRFCLIVAALIVAATTLTTNKAEAQNAHEWVAGPKVSIYARWNAVAGVGAYARYGITNNLRVEPAFVVLCKKGYAVDLSADLQYAIYLPSNFEVYPMVGMSYNHTSKSSLGVNLGAGTSYSISNRVSVNTSIKYMLQTAAYVRNPIIFSFGMGYRF